MKKYDKLFLQWPQRRPITSDVSFNTLFVLKSSVTSLSVLFTVTCNDVTLSTRSRRWSTDKQYASHIAQRVWLVDVSLYGTSAGRHS